MWPGRAIDAAHAGEAGRAHVGDHQSVSHLAGQRERLPATRRHQDRQGGPEGLPGKPGAFDRERSALVGQRLAREQAAHNDECVLHRRERARVVDAQAPDGVGEAGAEAQGQPAAGQLVECACVHRDLGGMAQKGVPDADPELDARGGGGACGQAGQGAALEWILGEPHRGEAVGLGGDGQLGTALRRQATVQADAESWRTVHSLGR